MVDVGHVVQPFNHAKQLVMLRLSSSHLIWNNFPCHFLSLAISKKCFSWDCFNRFPILAAVTTFPSVVTHTGFRISSWGVTLSSSAYLAAFIISKWWPDAMACSSDSLIVSTVWSEFWYNFSSDLLLASLYSCSTNHRPLPPIVVGIIIIIIIVIRELWVGRNKKEEEGREPLLHKSLLNQKTTKKWHKQTTQYTSY